MVLDPRTEFSPTQKEIIKLIPFVESMIAEGPEENTARYTDCKRFYEDLLKEYRWLECRGRNCYIEVTGDSIEEKFSKKNGLLRGISDRKILHWYSRFKKHYIKKEDERVKHILYFLSFKHMSLIRATYGNMWNRAPKDPIWISSHGEVALSQA